MGGMGGKDDSAKSLAQTGIGNMMMNPYMMPRMPMMPMLPFGTPGPMFAQASAVEETGQEVEDLENLCETTKNSHEADNAVF